MRRLHVALIACALVAAPAGLLAQQPAHPIVPPPARPPGQPGRPGQPGHPNRPQPRPSGYNPNRNNNYNYPYPSVYIDGNQYLATPVPAHPGKTPAPHHQTNNGQEVFSTYSTNNTK